MDPKTSMAPLSPTTPLFQRWVTTTALYRGLGEFCLSLKPFYLASLGIDLGGQVRLQGLHLLVLTFLDAPVSIYADRFSRKRVLLAGCGLQLFAMLCNLAPNLPGSISLLSIWGWLFLGDFCMAFGRNVMGQSLDAMVITFTQSRPWQSEGSAYGTYLHRVQRRALLLKFLAWSLALGLSQLTSGYVGYLCGGILGYSLLLWPLSQLPSAQNTSRHQPQGRLGHLRAAAHQLLGSTWGLYALASCAWVSLLRNTVHQNGVMALFQGSVHHHARLPSHLMGPLLLINLGTPLLAGWMNECLRGRRQLKPLVLCFSGAALCGVVASRAALLSGGAPWTLLTQVIAICGLQSSVEMANMGLHRLFSDSIEATSAYSMTMLLHAFGRLTSGLLLREVIHRYAYWHGPNLFMLSAWGFLGLIPLYGLWNRQLKKRRQRNSA